ncbi:hypothetical protein [Iodobacter fluviatilis]|uniref:hypothetical protein n=1 Tax=Iodobacter fluviatilis TaxID=537 RepID=UPI001CAA836D|nr:hypothetical protein [Iodobacter fluviatilis]
MAGSAPYNAWARAIVFGWAIKAWNTAAWAAPGKDYALSEGVLGHGLWPALRKSSESQGMIAMVFISTVCIGLFYASSLIWGQKTDYALIEYWRWWWVGGASLGKRLL